ncbi:MAG: KpsF/GutQ family sugar-phosphate isomerase [bacterium]
MNDILEQAKEVLDLEARSILELKQRLNKSFIQAVDLIYHAKGRVVVTGMGKSGLICKKIAATLASTGTPAFFLHPADALHGDLGMMVRGDVVLAMSRSGETDEIKSLIPCIKRFGLSMICITGNPKSTLAKNSDCFLDASFQKEACPFDLVPTVSTTVSLALGDALAIALLSKRGFKEEDFAAFHPGGALGRRLSRVADLMHKNKEIPVVQLGQSMREALYEMTIKRLGMACVVDDQGKLMGIITDGDLRRLLEKYPDLLNKAVEDVMTRDPKTISQNEIAAKAVEIMERYAITSLICTDEGKRPIGVIHLHDLLKAGVV